MTQARSLTGVWDGLYTYTTEPDMPQSHFTAVLLETGVYLSGTIHEVMNCPDAISVNTNAHVDGEVSGNMVSFTKTYDGTGGEMHSVDYHGVVNGTGDEIEGEWHIPTPLQLYTGRFLMVRATTPLQQAQARIEERV